MSNAETFEGVAAITRSKLASIIVPLEGITDLWTMPMDADGHNNFAEHRGKVGQVVCVKSTFCNNGRWKQVTGRGIPALPSQRYYEEDRLIENIRAPYPLHINDRTPLSEARPDIAVEWHHAKNDGYGPEDFSFACSLRVWWQCSKNQEHEWRAEIANRTSAQGSNCPLCYFESQGLDLTEFPQVLEFFDYKKNRDISPEKIPIGDKIYWHCTKGRKHDWHSRFNVNVVNAFCPFCRGRKASPDNNLTIDPVLAEQFHPTNNGELKAKNLVLTSKLDIWWRCPEGTDHEFLMRPYDRTIKGYGCPYCSRRRFSKTHSLLTEFPKVAKQWHRINNGDLKPSQISSRSKKLVWWQCPKGDDHEWEASVMNRTYQGNGCPFCANRALSSANSLAAMFPDIAKEFDKKKNHPLKANDLVAGSATEVWWKCAQKHSWSRAVYLRTQRGSRCPECPEYRKHAIVDPLSNHPKIAKHFHPTRNGELKPTEISSGSKQYVWWLCTKGPDHEWEYWVGHMTRKGYRCPFCEGFRLSATNSLKALYPGLAREWDNKLNDQKASVTLPGSAYKAWWRCCECGHKWQRECYLRTNRRSPCPDCKGYPD